MVGILRNPDRLLRSRQAEGYSYSVKHTLEQENLKEKFTEDEVKQVTELNEALQEALKTRELDKITEAKNKLEEVFRPIVTKIYEDVAKQQAAQNPQGNPGSNPFEGANNPFAQGFANNPFGGQ